MPRPGLVELVGGQSAVRVAALEGAVVDAALRALIGSFGLRALAIAAGPSPDGSGQGPVHRSILPSGWSTERGPGALLERNLQDLLARPVTVAASGPDHREIPIDGHRLWLYRTVEDGRILAAVAVRDASLPSSSAAALSSAIRGLASSLADRGVDLYLRHAMHGSTTISLKSEGDDVLAEVNADWPLPGADGVGSGRGRRTGVGRGSEPVMAVAKAAAKACRPRCEVLHAGVVRGEDGDVAVVLVRQSDGLRVGWAERARGDLRAVTEAVFTASF